MKKPDKAGTVLSVLSDINIITTYFSVMRNLLTCLSLFLLSWQTEALMSYDYAAWSGHNKDGSWTRQLERSVQQSKLPQLKPADIVQFCPAYPKLNLRQRSQFWVGLLSAMAKPESNFQPLTRYQEKFRDGKGKPVISRGLLQISQESANQPRYSCNITQAEQLHDPAINLNCAVRIMQKWVQTDGQISSSDWGTQAKGAARYWSVLRPARGQLPQIRRFTSQLPVCRAS